MPKLFPTSANCTAISVESSKFSRRPAPKVGVGMRKMMLFADSAAAKLGWGKLHLPASDLPETVYRSSTPPLGAFVFADPFELKKKGKRASRVGPLAVINEGIVLFDPLAIPLAITSNSGFAA